jgi:CheY-like chemotaxis protein
MAKVLFIWNHETDLSEIGNPDDSNDAAEWITSSAHLEALVESERFEKCFLLAELNWDGRSLTQFYGFKVLRKLRIKLQALFPVFICSTFPFNFFSEKGGVYNIFRAPGHAFIHLPQNVFKFKPKQPVLPLTRNLLQDINYHFFDVNGLLDELFHSLKGRVNYDAEREIKAHFIEISKIISPEQAPELKELENNLVDNIRNNPNQISAARIVSDYKFRVARLLPQTESLESETNPEFPWHVLCIDDEAKILNDLSKAFKKRGINCYSAQSGEKAFEILQRDFAGQLLDDQSEKVLPQNSIALVICDLRFLDAQENWQYWQGWDIIEHIFNKMQNMLTFFVLTTKKGTIVRQMQEGRQARVFMFSKEDVLYQHPCNNNKIAPDQSGFNIFAQRVREEAEKIHDDLCNLPAGEYWSQKIWKTKIDYPLQQYYRNHRLSNDYQAKEKWINECAINFIDEAELVKDPFFKRKTKIDSLNFDYNFKAGLTDAPGNPMVMEKFYTKLIGRRIAIGLTLKGWSGTEISSILKLRTLEEDNEIDRQLFSAYFAMSSNIEQDIPNHILIEEKNWVANHLGLSVAPDDRQLYALLKEKVEDFQDLLRHTSCSDDFLDEKIVLSNKTQTKDILEKVKTFAFAWSLNNKMSSLFEPLWQNKRLQNALRRNELLNFFAPKASQ